MNTHLTTHGDGVKDVCFKVEDATAIFDYAVKNGARPIHGPIEHSDENGKVIISSIKTYGDTTHTFLQNINYNGVFLPGYKPHASKEFFNDICAPVKF